MGQKDALHLAQRGHRDAVQNIVAVVEQNFRHADQRGVQFVVAQQARQFGRRGEKDLLLQPARQRRGVEVGDGADLESGQGILQLRFALEQNGPGFALEAVRQFLRCFRAGPGAAWEFVRGLT